MFFLSLKNIEASSPTQSGHYQFTTSMIQSSNATTLDTVARSGTANSSFKTQLQQVVVITVIMICLFILLLRIMYHRISWYKNTDLPHFGYALKFVFQIVDVLSDIFVCESMYINNDLNFFFASLIFLMLPLFTALFFYIYFKFSNIFSTYPASKRITEYFDNHWISLLLWCILSFNFYSGITLAQSKMFCLSMFNLQLKHREYESLVIVKFINGTLCESIAQIIIQILYLRHTGKHSLLIYISLTCSIFSILSQITIFLSRLINILIEYNKHVTHVISFDVKITLYCSYLQPKHEYTNKSIEKSLINAYKTSDESETWSDRGDVNVKYDVFYIDGSRLKTDHKMDVYFNVTVSCYNDIDNKIENVIEATITTLGNNPSSKIQKQFITNVKKCLSMKEKMKMRIVSKQFEIINKHVTNNELKNGVLTRLSIWRAVVDTSSAFTFGTQELPAQPKISKDNIQFAMITSGGTPYGDEANQDPNVEGDDNHTTTGSPIDKDKIICDINNNGYDDQLESEGLAISRDPVRSHSASKTSNEYEVDDVTFPTPK